MKPGRQKKGFLWVFLSLSSLVWIYIILRAWKVQFNIDEAATFFMYVQNGRFLPPEATIDANNHLFNSFLTRISYHIFGSIPFALRLPNVLAALIYFFFIYRLSLLLKTGTSRYLFIILSFGTHFIIEFFGYSRGYGLSLAFLTGAVYYLLKASHTPKLNHIVKALILNILAVASNLNLVFTGLSIPMLLLFFLLYHKYSFQRKSIIPGILFIVLLSVPAFFFLIRQSLVIKSASGYYYGSDEGYFPVTVESLSLMITGLRNSAFAYYSILLISILVIFIFIQWIRSKEQVSKYLLPLTFLALLLVNWIGSSAINVLMKVNFQEDRAAIHLLPLFYSFIAFHFDHVPKKYKKYWVLLIIPLLFIPIHSLKKISLHDSIYGHSQQVPADFFFYIREKADENKYPPVVSAYQIKRQPWAFMNIHNGGMLNPLYVTDQQWYYADYIIFGDLIDARLEDQYRAIMEDKRTKSILYGRKSEPVTRVLYEIEIPEIYEGQVLYHKIFETDADTLAGRELILLINMKIESPARPFEAVIAAEVLDLNRNILTYEAINLDQLRPLWDGTEEIRHVIVIGEVPREAHKLLMYVWNKREVPFRYENANVSVVSVWN
ncbi:MAG: glycosyltransferase family 39 protein [Bacteroidales bacterium]|nr:glycosyltransferase family 39 protein [Bacteroidales bacterium]